MVKKTVPGIEDWHHPSGYALTKKQLGFNNTAQSYFRGMVGTKISFYFRMSFIK